MSVHANPATPAMSAAERSLHVVRVTPERVEDALSALLAAGPSAASRFARQAENARIALDRIWCLADDLGRYRFAVLAVPSLGRTAMLLASHVRSGSEALALSRAIDAAAAGCADTSDIAQALVEPSRPLDIDAYTAAGLRQLATLDYLERQLPRSGTLESTPPPAGWTIGLAADPALLAQDDPRAIGASARSEIIAVLEGSYRDTRDCPGLAGMRRTADVLDGHFGLGARQRFWLVARRDGVAAGVCLFNTAPDAASAELVYLGLDPSARGQGVARALVAEGMRLCSVARIGVITLAVDSLNEPAKQLYASFGFRRTASRVALVRALHG